VRPWLDPKLQAIGYEHKDFSPARDAFDGALEGAADRRLPCDVAMRVPIIHGEIARDPVVPPRRACARRTTCNMDVEDLDEIMEVMSLWSIVSEISRQMKPDAAQRREFRRACR